MKFSSLEGREDGEHTGAGLVGATPIFARQRAIFLQQGRLTEFTQ